MAKGHPVISGRIGPVVVCYIKKDNSIVYRSRPKKYKQTSATVARSGNFGLASTAGRILRKRLTPVLPFPKDKIMQGKFSGAISKWMGTTAVADLQPAATIPALSQFSFVTETTLEKRWKINITGVTDASGMQKILIPAFVPATQVVAPAGCVIVECLFAAAACLLKDGIETGYFETTFGFSMNSELVEAREINPGIHLVPGTLLVCGIYLIYHLQSNDFKKITNNPKFMPAGVVHASYH